MCWAIFWMKSPLVFFTFRFREVSLCSVLLLPFNLVSVSNLLLPSRVLEKYVLFKVIQIRYKQTFHHCLTYIFYVTFLADTVFFRWKYRKKIQIKLFSCFGSVSVDFCRVVWTIFYELWLKQTGQEFHRWRWERYTLRCFILHSRTYLRCEHNKLQNSQKHVFRGSPRSKICFQSVYTFHFNWIEVWITVFRSSDKSR